MTESVRRRNSKWDLKEDPHSSPTEIRQDNAWSGRGGEFIRDKESKSKGFSSRDPKWSYIGVPRNDNSGWLSSLDPSSRNRSLQNYESDERDFNEMPKTMTALDADQSCSMNMSPGLDGWTQKNRSRSPKSRWSGSHRSRSRSRSPPHGFRREIEGSNDRRNSRPTPCTEFAAGRCRRGSTCSFLHQENHDYDRRHSVSSPENGGSRREKGEFLKNANTEEQMDCSRDNISHGHVNVYEGDLEKSEILRNNKSGPCNEFLRGKCHRGSSCRYAHHDASSDLHGTTARDHDKKDRNASYGHDNWRGPWRIPCRFFAAGNCRNGETCKFSHEGTARGSPEGRSSDDMRGHDLDHEKRSWGGGPKWSEIAPDSARDGQKDRLIAEKVVNNLGNENRSWGGPKWGEKVADPAVNLPSWRNDYDVEKTVVVDSRSTAARPFDNLWGQNLDNASRTWGGQSRNDKPPADRDVHKSPQWTSNNYGGSTGFLESVGSRNFVTSESAGAKDQYPTSINVDRGHNQDSQSRNPNEIMLSTGKQNISQVVVSVQPHSSTNTNGQSPQVLPTPAFNLHESVQQEMVSHPSSNPYNQTMLHQGELIKKPDAVDPRLKLQVTSGTPMAQNVARSEQVAQIPNLSVSLAQIFGNGQHLPQLYAALNPNSVGPAQVVAPLAQPDQCTEAQRQYDPVSDRIDQNKAADGDLQTPVKSVAASSITAEPNVGDPSKIGSLEENIQESCELKQPEQVVDKKEENTGHTGQVDADGRTDDKGKKSKDPKGMRMFKFALVEFVKELLKPTWKEGQMSKEAHKTIVKKVVDKVTGTIQGAQIPQTQEKIDHYLAYSKPKLTKLVQAYVEKYLKS